MIKILFAPDFRNGNPYQEILSKELEKNDCEVHFKSNIGLFSILKECLEIKKVNILHIHWLENLWVTRRITTTLLRGIILLLELIIIKALGIKIVWTIHNLKKHEKSWANIETLFNRFYFFLFDKAIAHCVFAKEETARLLKLKSKQKDKVEIIRHANYIGIYQNYTDKKIARKKLEIDGNSIVYTFFGMIRPYKGIFELINCFNRIENSNAFLMIVGKPIDSETQKDTSNLINNSVKRGKCVLEFVPDFMIQYYMNASDVIVLPYLNVLTSGAAILAMSFGKALILPSLGCNPEMCNSNGTIFYDHNHKDSLFYAMKEALNRNLEEMGKRNFEKVKEYEWNFNGQKTVELYRSVLIDE